MQHEFGLFDGELGSYLIDFLKNVEAPVVTTFHTIIPKPSEERKSIVRQIAEFSSTLIVMTHLSREILRVDYVNIIG